MGALCVCMGCSRLVHYLIHPIFVAASYLWLSGRAGSQKHAFQEKNWAKKSFASSFSAILEVVGLLDWCAPARLGGAPLDLVQCNCSPANSPAGTNRVEWLKSPSNVLRSSMVCEMYCDCCVGDRIKVSISANFGHFRVLSSSVFCLLTSGATCVWSDFLYFSQDSMTFPGFRRFPSNSRTFPGPGKVF